MRVPQRRYCSDRSVTLRKEGQGSVRYLRLPKGTVCLRDGSDGAQEDGTWRGSESTQRDDNRSSAEHVP